MAGVLGDEAGAHLAITLPSAIRDVEIAERAARQNLWIWSCRPTTWARCRALASSWALAVPA